jgi:hypothetical protein
MSVTLEVSKLSRWLKAAAACGIQGASDRGKRVAHGDGTEGRASQQRTRCVCACGPAWEWGQKAQAAAHNEHVAHARDAGGIEAQRLVESSRSLPGSKGSSATHGNARHAKMWHRGREESAAHTRCVRVWLSSGVCGQKAQAEAHIKHVAHACDSGGIEAQRLVESSRNLPGPKGASDTWKRVAREDVAQSREGRISSARGVCVWPSSGVWA